LNRVSSTDAVSRGSKVTFSDKYKQKDSKTAVLIGDSMCRGVGSKLSENSQMFSSESHSGARIESITSKLAEKSLGLSENSHAVIMVGTNNLARDGTSVIAKKYRDMLTVLKETRCRKTSVIGILRRAKDGCFLNSKRLAVNENLRKMCIECDVEYIDPQDIYKNVAASKFRKCRDRVDLGIVDSWGVHLNEWGQHEVAAVVFKHCVSFLG